MSDDWRFQVKQESGETMLLVGSEKEDTWLNVSWSHPLDAQAALCVLNNLTQALDLKLTGSCSNDRLLKAYRMVKEINDYRKEAAEKLE